MVTGLPSPRTSSRMLQRMWLPKQLLMESVSCGKATTEARKVTVMAETVAATVIMARRSMPRMIMARRRMIMASTVVMGRKDIAVRALAKNVTSASIEEIF
eukprot:GHVP01066947.1.p2 GENE.GHVP01066947.1~~GHVP01066947.1.p2  ORF type:complete len:101 (+),score=16.98 GHVP01066947.1:3-305(+)